MVWEKQSILMTFMCKQLTLEVFLLGCHKLSQCLQGAIKKLLYTHLQSYPFMWINPISLKWQSFGQRDFLKLLSLIPQLTLKSRDLPLLKPFKISFHKIFITQVFSFQTLSHENILTFQKRVYSEWFDSGLIAFFKSISYL